MMYEESPIKNKFEIPHYFISPIAIQNLETPYIRFKRPTVDVE